MFTITVSEDLGREYINERNCLSDEIFLQKMIRCYRSVKTIASIFSSEPETESLQTASKKRKLEHEDTPQTGAMHPTPDANGLDRTRNYQDDDEATQPPCPAFALSFSTSDITDVETPPLSITDTTKYSNSIGSYGSVTSNVPLERTPPVITYPLSNAFSSLRFIFTSKVDETDVPHYDKNLYRSKVEMGGAIVLNEVTSSIAVSTANYRLKTILISKEPIRTRNYLFALCLGIPCISIDWIDYICTAQKIQKIYDIPKRYYLDRGISRDGRIIEQKFYQEQPHLLKPFTKKIIQIHGTPEYRQEWSDLVTAGGGTVTNRTTKRIQPDVIVTDNTKKLSQHTKSFNIPCVANEWLIECIIVGEYVDVEPFLISQSTDNIRGLEDTDA